MRKKTYKRGISIILILLLGIILLKTKFWIKEHKITYQLGKYQVEEHFYQKDSQGYDFVITKKNNTYIYTIHQNLKKQKQILKEIKTYQENNVVCILPVYKKEVKPSLYCNLENQQVSLDYLIRSENEDFQVIKEKVKKYKIIYPEENNTKTTYKGVEIYNKNIEKEEAYILWNYKGFYQLKRDSNTYKKVLDYDLYDNIMSCVVENYYVLFENTSVNGIEKVYYYDIEKEKLNDFSLKEKLSKDSYINGVVEDKIYVTDRKKKREYTLDIKSKKLEEIDKDGTEYIIYNNNTQETLSKSDFFLEDHYFDFQKEETNYHYVLEENKLYKYLEDKKENSILLLELENIKEWKRQDEKILLLEEDTIYSYTEEKGLQKIVESNELKYNYKNIYNLWKK